MGNLDELRRLSIAAQERARETAASAPPVVSSTVSPISPVVSAEKNEEKASILHDDKSARNHVSNITSQHDDMITSNMLASKSDLTGALTLNELDQCALPTTHQAVVDFLNAAPGVNEKRIPITFRGAQGLDVLIVRLLRDGTYTKKIYKQDILERAIKLALYEHYTGKRLVEFGDEDNETAA